MHRGQQEEIVEEQHALAADPGGGFEHHLRTQVVLDHPQVEASMDEHHCH
jgi:hypothetical protein